MPRFYPLLAYHWTRSGVTAKAIRYLSLAGEQALAGAAYREAALFLADALALDQPAESGGSRQDRLRRARWERQLGEAYLGLGRTSDGRTHLSRALALLGAPLPTTKRQLPGRLLQQLAVQIAHRILPAKTVRRQGQLREESLEASRIYLRLTEVFWFANDTPALGHAGLRALNSAERAGPSPELARAYAMLCLAAGSIPIHPLARNYSRRALEVAHHRPARITGVRTLHDQRVQDRHGSLGRGAESPRRGRGHLRAAGTCGCSATPGRPRACWGSTAATSRPPAPFTKLRPRRPLREPPAPGLGIARQGRQRAAAWPAGRRPHVLEQVLELLSSTGPGRADPGLWSPRLRPVATGRGHARPSPHPRPRTS